jgi:hypothetical protein
MLKIEFKKKAIGSSYHMVVNGIEDFSSKVVIDEKTNEKFVRVTKEATVALFINSTFQSLGKFLTHFTIFHSYNNEWDSSIYSRAICSGENAGCVEVLVFLNYDNWNKAYSPNYVKNIIGSIINIHNHIEILSKIEATSKVDLFLSLRFSRTNYKVEINQSIKSALQEFNDIMDEVQLKLPKRNNGFTFSVPKEMMIALKQYLVYFPEYVEIVKGQKILFEVKTVEEGIYVDLGENNNIRGLNEYFNEYLNFVKSNIDILNPKFEAEISETKKEIFILGLKQQVYHLKQQLELKNFETKVLEREVDRYYNLLSLQNTKTPIYINNIARAENVVDIKIEFKQDLHKLQSDILALKSELTKDTPEIIKEEIKLIDNELLETSQDPLEVNQKPFIRIKRIFDQLTDDKSEFNKVIEKSKKLKSSLQKVGKTYNKVAEWIALPVIPKALLEL